YYTPGEEVFEIEMARITKPDGTTRQVYDREEYSVADESIRMYYDYRQVVLEFADLDVGDRLELRYRRSQVSQSNYFDNHFGDVWYLQDFVPKRHARFVVSVPDDRTLQVRVPDNGSVIASTE